jgi:glycosyltransferase involved in cell wall biosynthesis
MMRVAFLCTSSLDYPSPRGRWLPMARELARAGGQPALLMLHPAWDARPPRALHLDGVAARYVGQMHVYGYPGHRRAFGPAQLAAVALRGALALAAEAIRARPTHVLVAKPQPINGLAGLLAARALGRPLYLDCDDYEAGANRFASAWQRRMVTWWEDMLPRRAAAVTVNTRFLEQRCLNLGVLRENILYISNGISAAQFERPDERRLAGLRAALGLDQHPTLVYLGAMSTIAHGTGLLLEAFAIAQRALPSARLLMVGDGDDRPALQAQAGALGIDAATRWTGPVAPGAARAYLALADASVDPVADTPAMAARSPLKLVESLAQGTPVLTGAVGDRREMLDGGGLLAQPGDPQALAEAILSVLSDPALRARLGRAARAQAELFRWERLTPPWIELLQRSGD